MKKKRGRKSRVRVPLRNCAPHKTFYWNFKQQEKGQFSFASPFFLRHRIRDEKILASRSQNTSFESQYPPTVLCDWREWSLLLGACSVLTRGPAYIGLNTYHLTVMWPVSCLKKMFELSSFAGSFYPMVFVSTYECTASIISVCYKLVLPYLTWSTAQIVI
jgi:hypothetical protein